MLQTGHSSWRPPSDIGSGASAPAGIRIFTALFCIGLASVDMKRMVRSRPAGRPGFDAPLTRVSGQEQASHPTAGDEQADDAHDRQVGHVGQHRRSDHARAEAAQEGDAVV